jgi:hypothetical protein
MFLVACTCLQFSLFFHFRQCTLFSEEIPTEIFDLFEEIVQNEASNEIQNADPSKSSRFQGVSDADDDKFNQDHENDNEGEVFQ